MGCLGKQKYLKDTVGCSKIVAALAAGLMDPITGNMVPRSVLNVFFVNFLRCIYDSYWSLQFANVTVSVLYVIVHAYVYNCPYFQLNDWVGFTQELGLYFNQAFFSVRCL